LAQKGHDSLNPAGLIGIAACALEPILFFGDAEHRGKVTACGESHDTDSIGVDTIDRGIGPQPAYGGFAILDLSRKAHDRHQPVLHGNSHKPKPAMPSTKWLICWRLPALQPSPCRNTTAGKGPFPAFGIARSSLSSVPATSP
jgi:hypothetical protein